MISYKVDFGKQDWSSPRDGVKPKEYEYGGRRLRLVEFTKKFVEEDWCQEGHLGYVLEGEMEISFGGDSIHFGPGDGLFIPGGEADQHRAKILSEFVRLVLVEEVA